MPELASARLTRKTFQPIVDELLSCDLVLRGNFGSFQGFQEPAFSLFKVFLKRLIDSGPFLEELRARLLLRERPENVAQTLRQ